MASWNETTKSATRGTAVPDPDALTAPASFDGTYTQAESDALRADVDALRSTVAALLAALRSGGNI